MNTRITIRKTICAVSALVPATLALALGLFACTDQIYQPPEPAPNPSGAAGSSGDNAPEVPIPNRAAAGASSAAPTTIATGGNAAWYGDPFEKDAEPPLVDSDPIRCNAPDREQYKAAFRDDTGGGDPLGMQSAGMEHTALIVFDKSESMEASWDGRSKWLVASDTMFETVSPFQHYLSVGAIFFPTDDYCGVAPIDSDEQIDFRPGADFLVEWETSMLRYIPAGATPMSLAFEQANQAIVRACETGVLQRPFKVIVLTDGEPNCESELRFLTAFPERWMRHGIETHVVGLPGYDPAQELLESIAQAGGTDTFFSPSKPDEFEETMYFLLE